jgi:hypothetical protein
MFLRAHDEMLSLYPTLPQQLKSAPMDAKEA